MKANNDNTRHTIELADILREGLEGYTNGYKVTHGQLKAINDIISCRTNKLGGHIIACDNCGHTQQAYNSCRNRHCPKCQYVKQEQWVDKLAGNLLPGRYYHVVFTLPQELNSLILFNKKACYSILMKSCSQALLKAALNPDFLGAETGAIAVLHTWSQTLNFHPHVHMLVPAGGLSEDGIEWVYAKKKFFIPARALSRMFRGIMIRLLEEGIQEGAIKLPEKMASFFVLKKLLYDKHWNVYLKKSFAGANSVIKYLGRYTHRVAISNKRLVKKSQGKVSFWYKDNKSNGKKRIMTLENKEFIRRFLQHILPNNFYKVRYIGILAAVNSKTKKHQSLALIAKTVYLPQFEGLNAMEVMEIASNKDILLCPNCNKGRLRELTNNTS